MDGVLAGDFVHSLFTQTKWATSIGYYTAGTQCILSNQARQLMQMWASSVGGEESATPEKMVVALKKIPLTQDIVDRINKHCE